MKPYSLKFNINCKLVEWLGLTCAIFLYYVIHKGSYAIIAILYGIVLFGVPETVIQLIYGIVAVV